VLTVNDHVGICPPLVLERRYHAGVVAGQIDSWFVQLYRSILGEGIIAGLVLEVDVSGDQFVGHGMHSVDPLVDHLLVVEEPFDHQSTARSVLQGVVAIEDHVIDLAEPHGGRNVHALDDELLGLCNEARLISRIGNRDGGAIFLRFLLKTDTRCVSVACLSKRDDDSFSESSRRDSRLSKPAKSDYFYFSI